MRKSKKKYEERQRLLLILLIIAVSLSFILGGFIIYDKIIKSDNNCTVSIR